MNTRREISIRTRDDQEALAELYDDGRYTFWQLEIRGHFDAVISREQAYSAALCLLGEAGENLVVLVHDPPDRHRVEYASRWLILTRDPEEEATNV